MLTNYAERPFAGEEIVHYVQDNEKYIHNKTGAQ
jgi:hypothetical protein